VSEVQQIGPHRIHHSDIQRGAESLMGDENAWITYVDPPWGPGHIKLFATMNKKQTGQDVSPMLLEPFLSALFDLVTRHTDAYLIVEYGVRWRNVVQRIGADHGWHPERVVPVEYASGNRLLPVDLHLFAKPGFTYPPRYGDDLHGVTGYNLVRRAVRPLARPGLILLDPCCGMGLSARAALSAQMRFRGMEFNAHRLAKTAMLLA